MMILGQKSYKEKPFASFQVLTPFLGAQALSERFSLNKISQNDLHRDTKLLVGGGFMHLCCQAGWQNAGGERWPHELFANVGGEHNL